MMFGLDIIFKIYILYSKYFLALKWPQKILRLWGSKAKERENANL